MRLLKSLNMTTSGRILASVFLGCAFANAVLSPPSQPQVQSRQITGIPSQRVKVRDVGWGPGEKNIKTAFGGTLPQVAKIKREWAGDEHLLIVKRTPPSPGRGRSRRPSSPRRGGSRSPSASRPKPPACEDIMKFLKDMDIIKILLTFTPKDEQV